MTQIKTVCVDKVAYEAVLRNSIRVNDLEAENQQLKELLGECRTMLGQFEVHNPRPRSIDVIEMLMRIDNAIGEK